MIKPKHWTHSRLIAYEKCPAMYAGQHLNRWPGFAPAQSTAMERGNKIHGIMEGAVKGGAKLTGALARYNAYVKELRAEWPMVGVEEQLALTVDWQPCEWRSPAMWWRGKMDVECLNLKRGKAKVIDWKTGGMYGTNADQIRLYSGITFQRHKQIKSSEVELVYLDQKQSIAETINRKDWEHGLRDDFNERASAMLAATKFPAKPGAACDYCSFNPTKGGPCKDAKGSGHRIGLQTDSRGPRVVVAQVVPLRRRRSGPGVDTSKF